MTTVLIILLLLFFVGMLAGFIDTIAGGGGMITIPALLFAGLSPDIALGTNKLQGTVGSASASWYFIRRKQIGWSDIYQGFIASCIGSAIGAITIQSIKPDFLEKFIPVVLIIIAVILLSMPQLGKVPQEKKVSSMGFALGFALPIGFYDGFIGPGTGTFFMLALITFSGFTITEATIRAKTFNMASNVIALLVFLLAGKISWKYGLTMAAGQIIGARIASKMVIHKGHKIIKPIVIIMSLVMSISLISKYWFN